MPGPQHGFAAAITDIVVGVIFSAIITQIGGEIGGIMLFLFSLLSIISMIELFSRMNHWSLAYLFGWIFGLILLGPYLLSTWEIMLSLMIGVIYAVLKGSRKKW